jgi:hypothetical protein
MKDKLLFGTIGLLVGIVVMQWTMPLGQAEVVTNPVGVIVAQVANRVVVGVDGGYWYADNNGTWQKVKQLPVPLTEIHFIESAYGFVDMNGNLWNGDGEWQNLGHPPIGPVATEQSTWGKIKSKFSPKGDKP